MKILLRTKCIEQSFLGLLFLFLLWSCEKTTSPPISYLSVPNGFAPVEFDSGNEYSNDRWLLGKALFYETRLSVDNTVSCATCHQPEYAFTDPQPTTPGAFNRPGHRNAPTLGNVGYHPYFLKEGGVPTLEMQVLVPIQEHNEFANNMVDLIAALKEIPFYDSLAIVAYDREMSPFVLTRALGIFERSIVTGNSAYDQWVNGDSSALSKSELSGMELFFGKAQCNQCHNGLDFTNYEIVNNGAFSTYPDSGLYRLTMMEEDWAKFKIPSLRNIALTAPYMHNGEISSLREVVDIYNKGGQGYKNQSSKIHPLALTESEKEDLISFLKSLTDYSFVNDVKWKN